VNGQIIGAYGLTPIVVNHYSKEGAFLQKVSALVHRSQTQALDVFDLKFLIDAGVRPPNNCKKRDAEVSLACE
jgi:hypothetical protein